MITEGAKKVVLVGAGPGDPELISVKGLKAIMRADIILYDALVSPDLLSYASGKCKLVFVGKRKGKKEFSQQEINELIVFYAQRFNNVVRLKGGDPYVFGRGHEEEEFVRKHGIATEVVPGISSSIAAPASIGIPVTKRGSAESFWVITGMIASGEFSKDLILASKSNATVVVLMGMTHLASIAAMFSENRSQLEPIAIIQHGCTPEQRSIIGNASNIVSMAGREGISSPAVIVIGKVVNEARVLEIVESAQVKMKVAV